MAIRRAIDSEGYVLTRETDLEVLRHYLSGQQQGLLHVEVFHKDPTIESSADIPVVFARTPLGEYIVPWASESIADEMTNGITYLTTSGGKVQFSSVRELFFGDHKAFMVCEPLPVSEDIKLTSGATDAGNESS
jgi:hypothetical protein